MLGINHEQIVIHFGMPDQTFTVAAEAENRDDLTRFQRIDIYRPAAAAMILPVALAVEGLPAWPGLPALAAVLYLGIFPTAIATVMLVFVVQSAGPSFMSLVNYQVPVWAVLLGLAVRGEDLPGQFLVALTLILVGLAGSQLAGRSLPGRR